MNNKLKILAGILVLALVIWLTSAILFPPDENQKIEKVIRQAAAAFAEKSSKELGSFLTADFNIQRVADRDAALDYLKMFFLSARELEVSIKYLKHEVEKLPATATEARVLVMAVITGVVDGEKFQAFSGQGADTAILSMRKEAGRWLVSSARALDTSDPEKAFEQIGK